jgi:hypothetical protein
MYIRKHICAYICVHSFRRCYRWFGDYPNYMKIKMFVKAICKCFSKKEQHR